MNYAKELILLHAVLDFFLEMRLAKESCSVMMTLALDGKQDAREKIANGVNAREFMDEQRRLDYYSSMVSIYSMAFSEANDFIKELLEFYVDQWPQRTKIYHKGFEFERERLGGVKISTSHNDKTWRIWDSGFSLTDSGRYQLQSEVDAAKKRLEEWEQDPPSIDALKEDADTIMRSALDRMEDVKVALREANHGYSL